MNRARLQSPGVRTHGHASRGVVTREYAAWRAMIQSCTNPHGWGWRKCGARGVTVCARWSASFPAFLADMGTCPDGFTLARWPDPAGNFDPENCRWVETAHSLARAGCASVAAGGRPSIITDGDTR